MVFFILIFLFQIDFPFIKSSDFSYFNEYFKSISVEISSRSLDIPSGIYGARQAFYILKEKNFKIENIREEALPNIPGKFKLFILDCKRGEKEFKVFLLFKSYKKKWVIQSFKEIP